MTPKQKAIKQAYVDCFIQSGMTQQEAERCWNEEHSRYVNEDGYTQAWDDNERYLLYVFRYELAIECIIKGTDAGHLIFIPKSLQGIDNNNGWKSVENGLPVEKGDYFGCYPDGSVSCFFFNPDDDFDVTLFSEELTHYQKITKPDLPIF